ncbi:MAG: hypothetical protein HYU78_09845 [Rhodocyclales bacterium]|nr:hypothetical protein [Rhodocyclales bacterium]
MVLILVDGKSTVADLCDKTGNQQLVENALQELERDGLVTPQLEQDSVWEQSRKVAEEIKAAALKRLAKEDVKEEDAAELAPPSMPPLPPVDLQPVVPPRSAEPYSVAPMSISPQSVYPPPESMAPPSLFGSEPPAPPPPSPVPVLAEPTAAPVVGRKEAGRGIVERLSGVFSRSSDDESIKPIRRGSSLPYVSLPLAIALGVSGVVVLAALVFFLYPYDRHRPDLEAGLGRIVGQTVRIGAVNASFLPRPAISLDSVSVGDGSKARAARIRVVPELLSLLGSRPVFSSVEVVSAAIDGEALTLLPKAVAAATQPDAPVQVQALSFSRLQLSLFGLSPGELHGEILPAELAKGSGFSLSNADRSLRLQMKAEAGSVAADFEGYGWQALADSPYRFDSIQGKAVWDGRSLAIRSLDARIFDGAVQGLLVFEREAQAKLTADLTVKHMNVARLSRALGYPEQFEGEVAGTLKFSAYAAEWGSVLQAAAGEGEFAVQRGVLGGFDLVEAVRRAGKGSVAGGSTRFEQIAGRIKLFPESIRFTDLAMSSGALRSGGTLDVARDGKLSGRFDVEMRGSANVIRMPVAASGTLKTPALQAGR